ncbi:hypothetical protein N789_10490 [Arenimonas oryziterrae DSM 21050 = YC6267]|uniref:Uncharacterized protein n=1 Tax=Arenimonas oryziterrae DSM 21050 = YC6267 TaxID=1121015 RepID=A0A091AW67_9GAMM|nr:hypothetical protein N789_10490 [Arenimonas oryziterrae DSM 21050 = YC6267]
MAATSAYADLPPPHDGSYWVSALRDPARRDEALCALILRGDVVGEPAYRETVPNIGCRVTGTFDNTAQPNGVMGVFLGSRWSEEEREDKQPGGHFLLFDAAGRRVPVFERSNSLDASDAVIPYQSSGALAVVQKIGYSTRSDWDVDGIYVVPATTDQRPILAILVGAPRKQEGAPAPVEWSWRARDLDGDGTPEIQIGPLVNSVLIPKAVFRYSSESHNYEGPTGSLDGDFYVLPASSEKSRWDWITKFEQAHMPTKNLPLPSSDASPGESLRELGARFSAAREAGDYELADALVMTMAKRMGHRFMSNETEDMASYWVFERGNCNLDFLPQDKQTLFLRHNRTLTEGIEVCEIAELPADAKEETKRRMTQLIDSRVSVVGYERTDVYDQFARQRTINTRALELLADFGLADDRFERDGDSALIEQIRAGRVDNVRRLLEAGYDVNLGTPRIWQRTQVESPDTAPFLPPPVLPLQAVKDSLAERGEQALEVAKILLEQGANPYRLRWAPHYAREVAADPTLQARLDALLAAAEKTHNPISSEFRGYLVEWYPDGETVYARFAVGNGSDKTFALPAWAEGGDYLLGSLDMESHFETRMRRGTQWSSNRIIEHGWSPSTRLEIKPGESREVLYPLGSYDYLQNYEGRLHRLWINNYPGAIYSEPFLMHDPRYPVARKERTSERDWYGLRARKVKTDAE